MITRFFLFLTLVISNPLYCQIDSAKLDSLTRRIASSHKLAGSYQDSFIKAQDSALQIAVSKGQNNTSRDTSLLAERKSEEKRYESRRYVRTVLTALLLVLLVIGLLRFRKSKQS